MSPQEDKGKQVVRQYAKLRDLRAPLDQEYADCYRFTYPTLGNGFNRSSDGDGISNATQTRADQAKLLDSTGTEATRLLSSSTLSSLTPPNARWFDLAIAGQEDPPKEIGQWCDDSAERIHTMIHASNYDAESIEFMTHLMVAGQAGLAIQLKADPTSNQSTKGFHFESIPLHSMYCQETLNLGYIDTIYRQFFYTVAEAVEEFGLTNLPLPMQEQFKDDPHAIKPHRIIQAIRPRLTSNKKLSKGKTKRNLPWESIWVAADCEAHVVRESGYNEMPIIVPRWMRIPDTDYARGPVYDALPDLKSLNKVKEMMIMNMEMAVAGMWKVKDDGTINAKNIIFGPRRVIPVGDMDNLQPLERGGDIQFAMNEIANLQRSIRSMLLADQLGPTEKAITTATEVTTRNNQTRQILGPIFARLQSEFLSRLVDRCFSLAMNEGLLSPIPQVMAELNPELNVQYRSPLARSQKMQEVEATDQFLQRITNMALTLQKPELLDHVNFDAVITELSSDLRINSKLTNDENAIKVVRFKREKAQQAAQAQAQMMQVAQTAMKAPPKEPASDLTLAA